QPVDHRSVRQRHSGGDGMRPAGGGGGGHRRHQPRARRRHWSLVGYNDIEGFADALEGYARDPQLRRRHGEAGLEFAKTMDWDTINSAVLKVYRRAIAKRDRLARMTGR